MMQAPFPWFGGKSRVAHLVWDAFGDVSNYVEPFFGSGAVLLGRPTQSGIETVNDKDGYVANFWRAVSNDPEATARFADQPVNENDLHARHLWLVNQKDGLVQRLEGDPDFFDAKIAGWWVWGVCCWIGGGFCSGDGPWQAVDGRLVKTKNGGAGKGVCRKLPHLGDAGKGVCRQLPHLGDAGKGVHKNREMHPWFFALAARLRDVRVCCGDWSRVLGPSVTTNIGMTGVFLDPPYSAEADRTNAIYACEDLSVAHAVRSWCAENGGNNLLRIALCGYDGEHNSLEDLGWRAVEWKAGGGYGSQSAGRGRENSRRERIWFSPNCLDAAARLL